MRIRPVGLRSSEKRSCTIEEGRLAKAQSSLSLKVASDDPPKIALDRTTGVA